MLRKTKTWPKRWCFCWIYYKQVAAVKCLSKWIHDTVEDATACKRTYINIYMCIQVHVHIYFYMRCEVFLPVFDWLQQIKPFLQLHAISSTIQICFVFDFRILIIHLPETYQNTCLTSFVFGCLNVIQFVTENHQRNKWVILTEYLQYCWWNTQNKHAVTFTITSKTFRINISHLLIILNENDVLQ